MEKSNNNGTLIGVFIVGAAIGVALGLLFAPEKGSETREKLASKGDDFMDGIKEKLSELIEQFTKETESIKDKKKDFADNQSISTDNINVK